MGQDFTECWAAPWPVIGEAFELALAGETSSLENQRMFLDRNGYLEETFFTFSFSPIHDDSGVAGLFHPVAETTSRMLSERRTRALRDLAARAGTDDGGGMHAGRTDALRVPIGPSLPPYFICSTTLPKRPDSSPAPPWETQNEPKADEHVEDGKVR
jgi:hypothetical protein